MTVTPDEPWPQCGQGSDPATAPEGCPGVRIPRHDACLAHVTDAERSAYFTTLGPGSDIDHRGTPFSDALLGELLDALRDVGTGRVSIGAAHFETAQFDGTADFDGTEFSGDARFEGTQFRGAARFNGVRFGGYTAFVAASFNDGGWFFQARFEDAAHFELAQFRDSSFLATRFAEDAGFNGTRFGGDAIFRAVRCGREAQFVGTQFGGEAQFDEVEVVGEAAFVEAKFAGRARFMAARFDGGARFDRTRFAEDALFQGAQFNGRAWFREAHIGTGVSFANAQFPGTPDLGPLVCGGWVDLSTALFTVPFTLRVVARSLTCARTQWEQTATLRVRYATVDLTSAVLNAPLAVIADPSSVEPDDSPLADLPPTVAVTSVQGLDAAHLVLTDVDLSDCVFSGAFHLDQLRLEGRCTFAPTPTGLHRRFLWPHWWTRRRTLAEEHHWRVQSSGQSAPPTSPRHWRTGPHHHAPGLTPTPETVAALYRQLRKAFEDGKNEPGAADFYYGEMEMRRHDRTDTPHGERGLLWAYWLLSGYGMRASRALGWLALAMMTTIVLMMGFGLPQDSPKQRATGVVPAGGGTVTFEIDKEDPKNPAGDRYTSERFEKALKLTLNSVVFRSSGQDLTTAGDYIEMTSRFTEPVLLGLAALAIRGRVKRGN